MKRLIVFSLLAFMMSSCRISLHPLYDANTIIKEEKLNGKWIDNDGKSPSEWLFEAKKNEDEAFTGLYKLLHTCEGYTYEYEAALLKLGGTTYLDILIDGPVGKDQEDEVPILAYYVPSHNFYKVEFKQDNKLNIFPFDGDRLDKLVRQRKIRIKHENVDGQMVVTASTEDLQKFILKYAQDEDAFDDPLLIEKR